MGRAVLYVIQGAAAIALTEKLSGAKCILAVHKTRMNLHNSRRPKVKDPSMTSISIGKQLPDTMTRIPLRTNA